MKARDILKAIQKLNPAEKHRLREYLIDALTASSSTGSVLEEISGVATKYLNNYLAWFQVLESIHHQRNEVTVNDMIIKGNLIPNIETYDTLSLSKFTV